MPFKLAERTVRPESTNVFPVNLYQTYKPSIHYVLKLLVFFAFYFFIFKTFIYHESLLDTILYKGWIYIYHVVLQVLMKICTWGMDVLGYDVFHQYRTIILKESIHDLVINNSCLGMDVMIVFIALLVFYPAGKKTKFWFIPLGLVGIQAINVLRIIGLGIVLIRYPHKAWIDHHTYFNLVASVFIFAIYVWWTMLARKEILRK